MKDQQEVLLEEPTDRPGRVLLVALVTFDPEAVVMTEVHGEDVVRHVGHAVTHDEGGGQPVPEEEQKKKKSPVSIALARQALETNVIQSEFGCLLSRQRQSDVNPNSESADAKCQISARPFGAQQELQEPWISLRAPPRVRGDPEDGDQSGQEASA